MPCGISYYIAPFLDFLLEVETKGSNDRRNGEKRLERVVQPRLPSISSTERTPTYTGNEINVTFPYSSGGMEKHLARREIKSRLRESHIFS